MANQTTQAPQAASNGEAIHGTKTGIVRSAKRDKSRTVVVSYKAAHGKYGKFVSRRTILQVHDPENLSGEGDKVEVVQCRPISKTKRWKLVRVVEKSRAVDTSLFKQDAKKQKKEEEAQQA